MVTFIADGMLGRIAKFLRLAGYDTLFAGENLKDKEVIKVAFKDERILLTKDKKLYLEAIKNGVDAFLVSEKGFFSSIAEIAVNYGLNLNFKPDTSRCPKCNHPVRKTEPWEVKGRVPEKTFLKQKVYWVCDNCGQIYWLGSHWINIKKEEKEIQKRIERLKSQRRINH